MKKIAIIGASYLQLPLIKKAKDMGLETHVFAWAANDVGEKEADYFYPISIIEKDKILNKCKEINIDGICSIASDLASITVNYVAQNMGLISNTIDCTEKSTNKFLMRRCFELNGDPSPKSILIGEHDEIEKDELNFPLIVKPTDRSGSRGITKIYSKEELLHAVDIARKESFNKKILIEEFAEGNEYSVECLSWKGKHSLLQITLKYTTGSPNFIETGHLEPAPLSSNMKDDIKNIVFHALDSLGIEYGASHSEIKIDDNKNIKIIEIGARMGGDLIGSHLVRLTTGIDFVENVIRICIDEEPKIECLDANKYAFIKFIFNSDDIKMLETIKEEKPSLIIEEFVEECVTNKVTDSSNRHGYYILASDNIEEINNYLPNS